MKLQPLYDLQQEVNRLFIAGSKFAKGDPRLQKHIPVLQKLGEKAPVFAKLAKDIEELLDTDTQQSAEKLMGISTLLYSVLYTQGDMLEADVQEAEQTPNIPLSEVNTEYSYLQLKPVMEALTTSNSGRIELLKDALERNIFKDSRTYSYLDIALGDKYAELCDYVEKTIMPSIGKPIVPFLIQNFRYEDKTENVRRFRLLNNFGYEGIGEMTDKIFAESLPALQAEAVNMLSNDKKNEEFIIKLADDKNKLVREAAYKALAKLETRTSLEKLKDVYLTNKNKTNQSSIVAALAFSKLPFFFQEVFYKVVEKFEEFIALDKDTDDKVLVDKLERFRTDIDLFENKDRPEVYSFFERVLKDDRYNNIISAKKSLLENLGHSVSQNIIAAFDSFDPKKVLAFYEKNMDSIPHTAWKRPLWSNYFYKAVENGYSKEKIFDVFNSQFRNTMNASSLFDVYTNGSNYYYYSNDKDVTVYTDKIDKRWVNLLYSYFEGKIKWNYEYDQALMLINACEPKSGRFDDLLVSLLSKVMPGEQITIFKLIMEREIKNRFNIIYSAIEKYPKNTYYYALNRLKNTDFWKSFPKEYAAKFRQLYEKNKLEIYNEIADEIESK
ncbi:HEAT repeat domain-containing protein [Dysgonomonas sp. BGC7]|uniref:HEAT repeat domain-containing protein n=1 Tax=Dysgonomonas sp. BGC7 TaxID=1658008 RepID=UPI00067FAAC7|nr:HEAT repeat domain-containing protein [Dysgonomonas sp. BGC7]MBD8388251.1 HEAT repeat domain-containing protein [Dysgonomonas sp. BGC7]